MNDIFKEAFDNIKAESQLKDNTYDYLQNEILKRKQKSRLIHFPKFIYSAIACIILFGFSIKGYSIYFEEISFVSIDVNPSIELSLNRFDRVISIEAYNDEGIKILNSVNVKNKVYNDALEILIKDELLNKYINDNSYIAFTVQSADAEKESLLLNGVQHCGNNFIVAHNQQANVEYLAIDNDLRQEAHHYGISVGKYQAILELQQVNPNATIEEYKYNSIKEVKTQTSMCKQNMDSHSNINDSRKKHHH